MRIVPRSIQLWLLLALTGSLVACGSFSARADPPQVGAPAPAFELPLLAGGRVRLAEQRGRVVIVNFWATWCPPCVNEIPRLVRWHEQHQADGLEVLGVNALYRDSRPEVAAFAAEYRINYPVPVDEAGTVSAQWLAQQLPRSYVIDREGVVRFVRIGEITEADFEQEVLPLLRGGT